MSQLRPPGRAVPSWFDSRPAVIGHRGAAATAPENTVASFRAALGADAVETDVQLSSDDVAFLLHDDDLDRTTDARAQGIEPATTASTLPWERLRALDAGAWAGPEFTGERLPQLAVLAGLLTAALDDGRPLGLDLEIKTPSRHSAASVVEVVGAELSSPRWTRLLAANAVLVTSFDPDVVELACSQLPVPVGLLLASTPPAHEVAALAEVGLTAIVTSHEDLTGDVVTAAHSAGLVVGVYTANNPSDWDRLVAIDVDAIVTDDPHALLAHLGR